MDAEVIIVTIALVVVPTAAFAIVLTTPHRRAVRRLRKRATPIGSLVDRRQARISGAVARGEVQVDSLFGGRCVYCRIEVLQLFRRNGTDGNYSESWKPVFVEQRPDALSVGDETGTVVVKPASAISLLPVQRVELDGSQNLPGVEALLAAAGDSVDRKCRIRVEETRLDAGDRINVFGTPRARQDGRFEFVATDDEMLALGPQ